MTDKNPCPTPFEQLLVEIFFPNSVSLSEGEIVKALSDLHSSIDTSIHAITYDDTTAIDLLYFHIRLKPVD